MSSLPKTQTLPLTSGRVCELSAIRRDLIPHYYLLAFPIGQGQPSATEVTEMLNLGIGHAQELSQKLLGDTEAFTILYSGYSSRREKGWHVHIVLLGSRWRKAWLYAVLAGKNLLQAFGLRHDDSPELKMNLERWLRLMDTWGFGQNLETFESLMVAYTESGRHYHTTEHVSACLLHLDECVSNLDFPREVEIALWFHDAVYKPLSSNNEKESANWAASFLSASGATDEEADRVHRLIMVTKHDAPIQTQDESALVDIDLSILGADPATYDIFEKGIRKEYKLVPAFIYRKKRAEVLRGFLARPRIYTSGCFPAAMERQAKENLSRAISKLEGRV